MLTYTVNGASVVESAHVSETYALVTDNPDVLVAVRVGNIVSPFSVQIYIDKKGGKFFRIEVNPGLESLPVVHWRGTCQQVD